MLFSLFEFGAGSSQGTEPGTVIDQAEDTARGHIGETLQDPGDNFAWILRCNHECGSGLPLLAVQQRPQICICIGAVGGPSSHPLLNIAESLGSSQPHHRNWWPLVHTASRK